MKMKRKVLPVALLAALGASSAQAVNVGTDGTGQVLLFPYYTVQGGEETLLSVVNTTDEGKAVKIRFREAYNSREVLDFNIFLSPHDVWVGKIQDSSNGGAEIVSPDNTCTAPLQISQHVAIPFKTIGYTGGNADGVAADSGPTGVARTNEGYVEVIEMGVPINDLDTTWDTDQNGTADFIHDSTGTPDNCAGLFANYNGGVWDPAVASAAVNTGVGAPTGGLMGSLAIINVQAGTEVSVNATALADVYETPNHYTTGTLNPTLGLADPNSAVMINDVVGANLVADEPRLVTDAWGVGRGIDAVSAVLMANNVMNEWTVNPAVEAESAWVLTFPTKWAYADEHFTGLVADLPFTDVFELLSNPAADGMACENVGYSIYDREEQTLGGGSCDFSPCPGVIERQINLCYEVNVVQFGSGSSVMSAANTVDVIDDSSLPGTGKNGWVNMHMDIDPNNQLVSRYLMNATSGNTYGGLPVIGFAASVLGNSNVGVGAAYGTSNPHAFQRVISTSN